MKTTIYLIILIINISLFSTSIYDVQYTTDPGDGTYPSPLEGTTVSIHGIVTGIDFSNGRFFMTDNEGGEWNGIYVYSNDYSPVIGDSIYFNAEVYEYNGWTELIDLEYCNIVSGPDYIPSPTIATTNQIDTEEAFESVYVEVNDVTITSGYDQYDNWKVSDGSGSCNIYHEFFNDEALSDILPVIPGYVFEKIEGIVSYRWNEFRLNPRFLSDFYSPPSGSIISTESIMVLGETSFVLPIDISFFGSEKNVSDYSFELSYDSQLVSFENYSATNTLSQNGEITFEQPSGETISIDFTGDFGFIETETLLNLSFNVLNEGSFTPVFTGFILNDAPLTWIQTNEITLFTELDAIGDTITYILKPLQNIPVIATPGEEFVIECLAPANTTNWNIELLHNTLSIPIDITSNYFETERELWFITVLVPTIELFELYDLKVTATNNIEDITTNSVSIIEEFKDEYYFVHITDTHLPTHFFYYEEEALTDTSEIVDLREVINDINLLRPEFVLLTGDLVNEGELEDFQNRRYFTKAQRILSELEVPFFLVAGNHDLGGWDDTPPPDGTSRRNWWKFFGWNYLENPPASSPYYTQNYSFDYGSVHYTGLEAYDNYDGFMYNIYGGESFTNNQVNWLYNDVSEATNSTSKVIFYHYDFSDQINLTSLGVDMALWGHIHSNQGSIYQPPYNLATEAVCDGQRAYRVIKVADGILEPKNTVESGWSGSNFSIEYFPSNSGIADSVQATINNNHSLNFQNGLIKFIMPAGNHEYQIENGTLLQVDNSGDNPVCYVNTNIVANSNTIVSCKIAGSSLNENVLKPKFKLENHPNPFNPSTTISFNLTTKNTKSTKIEIYNLKGQKIKELRITNYELGINRVVWDGTNDYSEKVGSGVYLYKLIVDGKVAATEKCLLLK
ncbi:MAG: metallophosphoesterase [Candidatus Cloacimonetes bacterium]|nr:metallophosphoesterase [Candidatus Cloacimonadota bacterium]